MEATAQDGLVGPTMERMKIILFWSFFIVLVGALGKSHFLVYREEGRGKETSEREREEKVESSNFGDLKSWEASFRTLPRSQHMQRRSGRV